MKGTDKDLAAHFTIIKNRGRCLAGAPIDEVFGEVPGEDYLDSISGDIADAALDLPENMMYYTLNLTRVLAYKKEATEALSVFRDSPEKKSLLGLLDYAINRVQ